MSPQRLRWSTITTLTAYTTARHIKVTVPSGGTGGHNRCGAQWNAEPEWGSAFGGLGRENTCSDFPAPLRSGCNWQHDWLMVS